MKKKRYWKSNVGSHQPQKVSDFFSLCVPHVALFIFTCCLSFSTTLHAQTDIPLGTWRAHFSYNTIKSIAVGPTEIFAAAESGIVVLDITDNSLSTYNTLNGLSSTGISNIAFDPVQNQLLIAYFNGDLDVLKDATVINFNRLKNSTAITGSKTISHIAINNNLAYLSTDYGVVVFDLVKLELKETWRDLGALGKNLKIFESTFRNDSIFLATEKGILAGNLNANLLDFKNWKRFDTGDLVNPIEAVVSFRDNLFAAIDGFGIYQYKNGAWAKENILAGINYNSLSSSLNNLFITEGTNLWELDNSNVLSAISTDLITTPLAVMADAQQNIWIGDATNGLLSNIDGNYNSYLPNGPSIVSPFRLKFFNEKLFALSGGYSNNGMPLNMPAILNIFSNGAWETSTTTIGNLTDIDFKHNEMYLSSFGSGVERTDAAGIKSVLDGSNSPLKNSLPSEKSIYVTDVESYGDDLWVTNYGAQQPLHLLKSDNTWESFSFSTPASRYPTILATDFDRRVWMSLNPRQGGGILVFDRENNSSNYLTELVGSGALPSRGVYAMAVDREGEIWIGTDQGVAYFFSPARDAIKPIFENRFLLRDEKVTAIEVDGGNRKWIGTEHGVWVFNATGEKLIYNFTAENSPLLSDVIRDIEINDATGEVFFSTDKGIISYRTDATAGEAEFSSIKIFPNPVTYEFAGTVAISGLVNDAIVKITDVSGRLIWQTQANGGTASWNVRDYNGKRASTGVYLVFAATADGAESIVGKIAVIE